MKRTSTISLILKLAVVLAVTYGVIMSMDDTRTFTKFTTLSNIAMGVVMLLFLIVEIASIRSSVDHRKQWMFILKFMMTIGVIITFVMYITMIAPKSDEGIIGSYANHHYGSLMLHFIAPVLSVIDFYKYDDKYQPRLIHAAFAILPPLAYVGYVKILAANGYRWAHGATVPYTFLSANSSILFLMIGFILIGMVMLLLKRKKSVK